MRWWPTAATNPPQGEDRLRPGIAVLATRAEDEAFAAHARELTWRAYPRLGLFITAAAALWWPLDRLVLPERSVVDAYFELRLILVIAALGLSGLFAVLPVCRRFPGTCATVAVAAVSALTAHYMGIAGDFGGPWFHFLYGCPILSVPLITPPARRLAAATVISLAVWAGYIAAVPGYLSHPLHWTAVSFLAFATMLSVVLGHLGYRVVRANFVHRTRLAGEKRELRALTERLGAVVDERTEEIRRLASHIERVREEERRWLAHEIHDELGQELAALRYALVVARTAGGSDGDAAHASLDEVSAALERMATTTRRILSGLRPAVLDEMGAVAAVRWLAKDIVSRGDLAVDVDVEPDDFELNGEHGTAVFRIVQEALTNVIRHAHAEQAEVRIGSSQSRLSVVVSDDGVGMTGPSGSGGLGLVGIRERARALGGTAEWSRAESGGTALVVSFPYPGERSEPCPEP